MLPNLSRPARAEFFAIHPVATYLHTSSFDPAPDAISIALASLPFPAGAGDLLLLERVGDYDFGPGGDVGLYLGAVFSSSSTLLPRTNAHRVPGAIDAGVGFFSGPNGDGSQNDIPEDFLVADGLGTFSSVVIQVPNGAEFLFVAALDSHWSDNSDPDGDYGIRISAANPVPEPASLAVWSLLAVAGAGCVWRRKRRRRQTGVER
jgi:hypothetical protein